MSYSVGVSHKGRIEELTINETTTLDQLRAEIAEVFGVEPHNQRLLYRGALSDNAATVKSLIPNGGKIVLVGATTQEYNTLQANVERRQKGQANYAKYKATSASVYRTPVVSSEFGFGVLDPLLQLPQQHKAMEVLRRLANDVGVREVMRKHEYRVGVLRELHPNERAILGYNRNRGQVIALRLRTDDLEGFRDYLGVRQVLMHELAHMVWDKHDDNFHRLNRQHCGEVVELDWTRRGRTVGATKVYEPPTAVQAGEVDGGSLGAGGFVLGGQAPQESLSRDLAYQAWLRRSGKQKQHDN
ncbi:hypothetical protein H4R24_001485 [Coemansia sp. RSA 988]|nr:hypothetical protein H4R24_001485 [Coemansia sp. RSA 988]